MKKQLGLIGKTLKHSFSQKYFTDKFEREGLSDEWDYSLFELGKIEEIESIFTTYPNLVGLNVTIPYKLEVMDYLDWISTEAQNIGAVNTIVIENGQKKGLNTDVIGFRESLENFIGEDRDIKALVLGTGGASRAVTYVLEQMDIAYIVVSRSPDKDEISYTEIDAIVMEDHRLVINTTPVGTYPDIYASPNIPYQFLTRDHYLFDLVYNPEVTEFMKKGDQHYAHVQNGYEMLVGQAEAAWDMWKKVSI